MNHLKIYENFKKEFKVDLFTLIDYTNDFVDTIYLIRKFQRNSSNYYFIYKENKYKRVISYIKDRNKKLLYFSGTGFSYEYLIENPDNNIQFTFYDVDVNDDLLALVNSKKYNL